MKKRITSLLLTLVMVLAMLPASLTTTAEAANDQEGPPWWEVNKSTMGGNYGAIKGLQAILKESGVDYIRLTSDIKYVGDKDDLQFAVKGVKHLDLNGHELVYGTDKKVNVGALFIVTENSELHIYDSKGSGGYIHYEGRLGDWTPRITRDLIVVGKNAKLVVNGGVLEAGRSKEIWCSCWGRDDSIYDPYSGYVRQQVEGSAVELYSENSTCIINGGKLYGRGQTAVKGSFKKAAIKIWGKNSTLIINGGHIQGSGGASCIVNSRDDENFTLKIRSAEFDTKKLSKIYDDCDEDVGVKRWAYGKYGVVFDKISEEKLAEAFRADAKVSRTDPNDLPPTQIRPRQSASIGPIKTLGVNEGILLADPGWTTLSTAEGYGITGEAERIVRIKPGSFQPYFAGNELALEQDYNNSTYYTTIIQWQIFDKDGKSPVSDIQMTSGGAFSSLDQSVDMRKFKDKDEVNKLWLVPGQFYKLRCTVTEVWNGYSNRHEVNRVAEMSFGATVYDLSTMNFRINAEQDTAGTDFRVKVTPSARENALSYFNSSALVYGYELEDSAAGASGISMSEQISALDFTPVTFGSLPTGKQTVIARLTGQDGLGLTHEFTARQDIFVMPRVRFGVKVNNKWFYKEVSGDTLTVPKQNGRYPTIRLRGVSDALLATAGLDASQVSWEMWNTDTGKWEGISSDSVTGVSISDGMLVLKDSRSGSYRARVFYNGKSWYSPQPFNVIGKDYSASHKITATLDKYEMEKDKDHSATVTLTPNYSGADWGSDWYGHLIVYKDNVPASFFEYVKNSSGAQLMPDGGYRLSLYKRVITGNGGVLTQLLSSWTPFVLAGDHASPGKYTFVPGAVINKNGTEAYTVTGAPFTVTVNKRVTSVDITADGVNITKGGGTTAADAPKVIMDTSTNKMRLGRVYAPTDANLPNAGVSTTTTTWSSSDRNVATVDSNGNLTAKQPGTTTITMTYQGKIGTEEIKFTRYIRVVVPIAEVKFSGPDWSKQIGKKYRDVSLNITEVRSANGEWVTGSKYMTGKLVSKGTIDGSTYSGVGDAEVAYNDSWKVYYELKAKEGYQLPVKQGWPANPNLFIANDMKLKTTRVDSSDMNYAANHGYYPMTDNGHLWDIQYDNEPEYGYKAHNCAITVTEVLPCLKDPNAIYLDTVSIETDEPMEGDLRYGGPVPESDQELSQLGSRFNFMNVNVITLMSETATEGGGMIVPKSLCYKLKTPLMGGGTAYAPLAEGEASNSSYGAEWIDVVYDSDSSGLHVSRSRLENTRYEAATYAHSLKLFAGKTGQDGKKYYFDPNVTLLVNGRAVELITDTGKNGYSADELEVGYYVVADPRPAFISGTVFGLAAPVTGETPQTAEALSVTGQDTKGNTTDKIYVSGLSWFIDENDNGQLDAGEECAAGNGLTADGKFLGGKTYKVHIALSAEPEDGRIDNTAFTLKLDGVATPISTTAANAVYTFAETEIIGYALSGKVQSYDPNVAATVKLMQGEEVKYTVTTDTSTGSGQTTQTFRFETVEPGTYDLVVSKSAHLSYTVKGVVVTGGDLDLTQHEKAEIAAITLPAGDVNGDGTINSEDLNMVWKPSNYLKGADTAENAITDVNGDGTINSEDLNVIWMPANYLKDQKNCTTDF